MLSAAISGDSVAVQRLLSSGADPNVLSENRRLTPLIVAAAKDNAIVVRLLLNAGATVSLRNNIGATALEFAAVNGSEEAVKALVAAGANPNAADDKGLNPIHRASIEGHSVVVQELVNAGGDITIRAGENTPGDTALGIAAHNGHLDLVKLLLELGADVDAENTMYKQTPMHRAASENAGPVLVALIDAGGTVDYLDIDGDTPLFTAAFWGNQEAIEVLLENGADKSLANKMKVTPSDALCKCISRAFISESCKFDLCQSSLQTLTKLLGP